MDSYLDGGKRCIAMIGPLPLQSSKGRDKFLKSVKKLFKTTKEEPGSSTFKMKKVLCWFIFLGWERRVVVSRDGCAHIMYIFKNRIQRDCPFCSALKLEK